MHACAFRTHLRPPSQENTIVCAHRGFYMSSHAGLGASHIRLVAIEFRSYTVSTKGFYRPLCMCILHLEAHIGSVKCAYHSAIFPMDSSCWLTHAVQGLANQYWAIPFIKDTPP